MKRCPACQNENDDLAVKCGRCGIYLKNPRFNWFNFDYDYFFTNLLSKKPTFSGVTKAVVIWFFIISILAGIGFLLLPVIYWFGVFLGPDASPYDVTKGVPPWVMMGAILGALFWVYIFNSEQINDALDSFREWFSKFGRKS